MKSLSIGLVLSVVFGCVFLALVSEVYYLLWWKKKRINQTQVEDKDGHTHTNIISPAKEFLYMLFCKKPSSPLNCNSVEDVIEPTQDQDFWFRPFGEDSNMDSELMRLSGPPRFLFTIKEETKEDLESEDGKSRNRSQSEVFLTPVASPPYFTPPRTPTQNGFESPPPTFKFLRDAEEKFCRRFMEETPKGITKKYHSSSSQVLPLASSPPSLKQQG